MNTLDRLKEKLVGRVIKSVDDFDKFTLDDGTQVYVGGGENALGGYGFLTLEVE